MRTSFSFKLDDEQKAILLAKAEINGVSLSEYVRNAAMEKAMADINLEHEIVGVMENILKETSSVKKLFETFSIVFNDFLKYFFLMHNIGQSLPSDVKARQIINEKAEKDRDYMFTVIQKQMKNRRIRSLTEQFAADYMEEEIHDRGGMEK